MLVPGLKDLAHPCVIAAGPNSRLPIGVDQQGSPARTDHPPQLPQRLVDVRQILVDLRGERKIKCVVPVPQTGNVLMLKVDMGLAGASVTCQCQHGFGNIHGVH